MHKHTNSVFNKIKKVFIYFISLLPEKKNTKMVNKRTHNTQSNSTAGSGKKTLSILMSALSFLLSLNYEVSSML